MRLKIKSLSYGILIFITFIVSSCKKYLDAKSDSKLAVPETLASLQAILDNVEIMNNEGYVFANNASDEYYLDPSVWLQLPTDYSGCYVWDPQLFVPDGDPDDWLFFYRSTFYANSVLDNLKRVNSAGQEEKWNNIKGEALFFRAWYYFYLSQIYAKQYDSSSASNDLGIVLRLNSDQNVPVTRSTVQQTYDQILSDLNESVSLLDSRLPINEENKTRPTKAAAYALLARVYLQLGNYSKVKENADVCLNLYSALMDFNANPNKTDYRPIPDWNPEILFRASTYFAITSFDGYTSVDSELYNLYDSSDLRKTMFFEPGSYGGVQFEGNYCGDFYGFFTGIATDEIFLLRAEANARLNNLSAALIDLNTLLQNRIYPFIPVTATTSDDALKKILVERRKELLMRGVRWSDLKRLNKDSRFAVTLQRNINGQKYQLPPNDLRYSFLIPNSVIQFSGVQQNPR